MAKPKIGAKVKVQVGRKWLLARVAELLDGGVVRVELDTKDEHKSVYAKADGLRPVS